MSYTGLCHVHAYSTEFFFCHFFLCHASHHIRSCNKHITGVFHHQNKIGQCRRINRTTGTRSHDRANLWNHSGCHRIAQEYLGISGQRTYSFLNSCTSRVIQSDDGCSHLHGHVHHFTNFLSMRFRKSSSKYGEILCEYINQALANHTISRHNPVSGKFLLFHTEIGTPMGYQLIQFDKRTFLQ